MKAKYDFRHGQRYIFVEAESLDERDFLRHFFNSPEKIEEQLSPVPEKRTNELILSKGM